MFTGEVDCTYFFTWYTKYACVKEREDLLCRVADKKKHYDLSPLIRSSGMAVKTSFQLLLNLYAMCHCNSSVEPVIKFHFSQCFFWDTGIQFLLLKLSKRLRKVNIHLKTIGMGDFFSL